MIEKHLSSLQAITAPYANTSQHVQGPGGNTSFKINDQLLIKASGFTFKDVTENTGVVLLHNGRILDKLSTLNETEPVHENATPDIVESIPAGVKPSMEFEFHSLLDRYVLHTHSVYANIITCSTECAVILSRLFDEAEYQLLPYVTPGLPIARELLNSGSKNWKPVIFLKNHGIIVHGKTAEEVVSRYNDVEEKIKAHLQLQDMPELEIHENEKGIYTVKREQVYGSINLAEIKKDLVENILIPDQSIFFRNKISFDASEGLEILVEIANDQLIIAGSEKFLNSARAMLQSVYYIKKNIDALGFTPDFIPKEKLDILHGLATEKYRLAIIKN